MLSYGVIWGCICLPYHGQGYQLVTQAGKLESVQSPPSLFSYLYSETTIEYN